MTYKTLSRPRYLKSILCHEIMKEGSAAAAITLGGSYWCRTIFVMVLGL